VKFAEQVSTQKYPSWPEAHPTGVGEGGDYMLKTTHTHIVPVTGILLFAVLAGIALQGMLPPNAQASGTQMVASPSGGYAVAPIKVYCSLGGYAATDHNCLIAISPEGEAYILASFKSAGSSSQDPEAVKVIQRFRLEDSKAGEKW